METLSWKEFQKVDMRVGTIKSVTPFEEAIKPAYKLQIDFGELGMKKSSAQITQLYQPADLIGKQVIAVVNFPPKQIANFMSECLVLGAVNSNGEVTLLETGLPTPNGLRIS
ncbi:tRNA-binding protein [Reichenbachiella ulvae]|uniref:tRNA-binding protein n=1 Tax=Reichenbachiella ulvae TaxID=2980104 RepID=A0ABT3CNV1_9BACT|nr:tRNA-binding protein [Reichenbachiella ulvae]MCV9385149.1 tRNA-binding protein [Reichenbachiella ulvae]